MKSRNSASQVGTRSPVLTAFHTSRYIGGLTHGFYRYPATTSPDLVRELLLGHTDTNDVVMDPFMGGGTTVVEAVAHGRRVIGGDLNSLAVFVTRTKTTPLTDREWDEITAWLDTRPFRRGKLRAQGVAELKLPTALHGSLARALARAQFLRTRRQENLVRCALLRTAQWALESSYLYPRENECRNLSPSIEVMNSKLREVVHEMHMGMDELVQFSRGCGVRKGELSSRRVLVKSAAEDLRPEGRLRSFRGDIRLVLTSPPYPNVHVLYHRWQIGGRRETPAPYWIAGQNDGMVLSYYTMGARSELGRRAYFERLELVFAGIRPFLRRDGLVVQIVAFNDSDKQLPQYLAAMERAGYRQLHGRRGPTLVREVPNRRWYARGKDLDAGREYLLVHAPIA